MSIITFKIIAAVLIFIIATLAGLLPAQLKHFHPGSRHISDAITNGIFLGVALFHMLPDAQEGFVALGINHYPYAILLCLSGLVLLQVIKYVTLFVQKHNDSPTKIHAIMILFALSFHSLVEGAALGINTILTNAFVIFVAIVAHKSCDSFALATTLKRYQLFPKHTVTMIFLFALTTPLGIAIASSIISLLQNDTGIAVEASLNAVAAGTFIYIGTADALGQQFKAQTINKKIIDFMALLFGMGIMGFIAIWA